uniref:RING-type domain-containing protein n=1 Tax=Kalanchoe fedtschenkoi TaxID=63787 RepID=A0A7N0V0P1_KALFE
MLPFHLDLSTLVLSAALIITIVIFMYTRYKCGQTRQDDPAAAFETRSTTDIEQPEHLRTGGPKAVLVSSIQTLKFEPDTYRSIADAQCAICLGMYLGKEVLRIMPQCGHDFHLSCIDEWLMKNPTCPVCRLPLPDAAEQTSCQLSLSMIDR